MEVAARTALLTRYEQGFAAVRAVLDEGKAALLDVRTGPDDWSAREIVHHLADSEMTSAIRLRRLLVEDAPVIHGYDEGAFAQVLFYDRPIDASMDAFRAARETNAQILRRLDDAAWTRTGTHSESGEYSVETWLEIYASHGHDHAEQMRASMGLA